jgi:hypothetical protein
VSALFQYGTARRPPEPASSWAAAVSRICSVERSRPSSLALTLANFSTNQLTVYVPAASRVSRVYVLGMGPESTLYSSPQL